MIYKYSARKSSDEIEHEKDLIKRVQLYDDRQAMKELLKLYAPLLQFAIKSSGVLAYTNSDTASTLADGWLKSIIKDKMDLNMGNLPSTYITGNIKREFQKWMDQNSSGASVIRMPQESNRINKLDNISKRWLSKMDMPTTEDSSFNFIKDTMGLGGEKMSPESIGKTRMMERRELSSDKVLGGGLAGADIMTFGEMAEKDDLDSEEFANDYFKKQQIEAIISGPGFSRAERKYIRQIVGLGEFKSSPLLNKNQAAINSGLTYSQGKTVIKKVADKMGVL